MDFVAAHNASFDRSVVNACCAAAGLQILSARFLCTVKLSRALWKISPTTLADVCRRLQIPLKHHDAASDALACARIVMTAVKQKAELETFISPAGPKPKTARPARSNSVAKPDTARVKSKSVVRQRRISAE